MERVYRLTGDLACIGADLPEGTLVREPHSTGTDELGNDFVFLASTDGGQTWKEHSTVIGDPDDWFEPVKPS